MNMNQSSVPTRQEIKEFQHKLNRLRTAAGISPPGTILYWADGSPVDDEVVIAEADGVGGGTLRVVRGRYPFDYQTQSEKRFDTEAQAQEAAAAEVEHALC